MDDGTIGSVQEMDTYNQRNLFYFSKNFMKIQCCPVCLNPHVVWPYKRNLNLQALQCTIIIVFSFIYCGCEPGISSKVNLITVPANNPWREDNEGNFSFRGGRKTPDN